MAREIVRKQGIVVDDSPGERAFAREVDRDLRAERSGSDEDNTIALGSGVPRRCGGEFPVERDMNLSGLNPEIAGRGNAFR